MQIGNYFGTSTFYSNTCLLQTFWKNWSFDFVIGVSRREDYKLENVRSASEFVQYCPPALLSFLLPER